MTVMDRTGIPLPDTHEHLRPEAGRITAQPALMRPAGGNHYSCATALEKPVK
jgi:hypothetical protein